MAVGVPETAVFEAADAVLARGERPTVERVRLELGRGSPARVGALLDQWWEQLAERLRGETRLPGIPSDVAQAFVAVWQQASLQAQAIVEQSHAAQRQVLAEERERVAKVEEQVRQEAAGYRRQAAEAVAAQRASETRLADLAELLEQRLVQIEDLRQQREDLGSQRDQARQELANLREQLSTQHRQAEHARDEHQRYTRDVEDRAFREIDRAREESKGLAARIKDGTEQLLAVQKELKGARAEVSQAQGEGGTLRAQLQAQALLVEQLRRSEVQTADQHLEVQRRLQVTQTELAASREQAAAAMARAETLAQQLERHGAAARSDSAINKPRRVRKSAPKLD